MKHWLLVLPLIASSLVGLSQTKAQMDSLQQLLTTSINDRQRVSILNRLSEKFSNKNSDTTLYYASEAFRLASQIDDDFGMAIAQKWMGVATSSKGDYEKSLTVSFESMKRFETLNESLEVAAVKSNVAGTYYQFGNYELALTQALESRQIALALKDTGLLVSTGTFIGSVYSDVQNYQEAIHSLKRVIKLRWQKKFKNELSYPYYNLGNAYAASGHLDSALNCYQKSNEIANRVTDMYLYQASLVKIANTYIQLSDFNKAEQLLTRANAVASEGDFQELQPDRFLVLIELYRRKGNMNRAFKTAWYGIEFVKNSTSLYFEYDFAFQLSDLHRIEKRYDSAYFYLQRATFLRDSIDRTTDFYKVANWNFDYQLRQQEIKEKELLITLKLEKKLLAFAVAAILVLLLLTILIWRLYRHRIALSKLLLIRNHELNVSLGQVKTLNVGMREMMAQVTHDLRSPLNRIQGLLQLISKSKHDVDEDNLLQLSLREVKRGRAFVDSLLRNAFDHEWIPEWTDFDVAELVSEIIGRFDHAATEKNISLETDLHTGLVRSDRLAVDRILDNLLSNAIKYSPAGSTVCCSLAHQPDGYTLRVADKGPGFTEEDQKKMFTAFQRLSAKPTGGESSFGVGLSSVNDLVKVLKGSIELKTSASLGSEFIIRLPNHPTGHAQESALADAMEVVNPKSSRFRSVN